MVDVVIISFFILFLFGLIFAYYFGYKAGAFRRDKYWESEIPVHRKDAILKSRAILGGQFSEQLAPFLPNFPFSPTECRFMGKPIDLIVFKGMDGKNIEEVVFVEVKSGNSNLSPSEKKLKEAIDNKKVSWYEYRAPKITKEED
ncbi:hypothetical protein K0A97_02395 [Patescibacteria group bacterium]|nr:hypothetical protein [Patescibacteria group bacterium]